MLQYRTIPVTRFQQNCSIVWCDETRKAAEIGRTDFPQGNFATLIRSITERLWPMGDHTVFIPGHGPESTFGRERNTNPYVANTCPRLPAYLRAFSYRPATLGTLASSSRMRFGPEGWVERKEGPPAPPPADAIFFHRLMLASGR